MSDPSAAKPPADATPSRYEEIVQRLSRVVERLESGGLSLEDSVTAFEEGIKLARAGAARLEEAERKVELLLADDRTAPFETGPQVSASVPRGGAAPQPVAAANRPSPRPAPPPPQQGDGDDGDIPF